MGIPVEKKESRTWPILGTIAAIVLCGLGGLCILCPLSLAIFAGTQNQFQWYFPNWYGVVPLCLSVVFIAIGIVVPILLLRKKKPAPTAATIDVLPPQNPLPPQSPLPMQSPVPPQNPPQPPLPPDDALPPTS